MGGLSGAETSIQLWSPYTTPITKQQPGMRLGLILVGGISVDLDFLTQHSKPGHRVGMVGDDDILQ